MSMALAERLERAADRIELDRRDLARVLDTSPRTVSRWLSRGSAPRPDAKERMLETVAVLERLASTLTAGAAHDWLFTPNGSLDNHKPINLLRDREFRPVLGAVDALAEGVFV
jgi:putative toxin-antitoxin system antitoxin component (TIGR02293 family)